MGLSSHRRVVREDPSPPSHPGLAASGQLLGPPLSLAPQGQAAGPVEWVRPMWGEERKCPRLGI